MPGDDAHPEPPENDVTDISPVGLEIDARGRRTKHLELLDQLVQAIDVLTFVQLSVAYLCDCLTSLLLLRTIVSPHLWQGSTAAEQ